MKCKLLRTGTQIVYDNKTYVVVSALKKDYIPLNPYEGYRARVVVVLIENTMDDFLCRSYDKYKDRMGSLTAFLNLNWKFAETDAVEEEVVKGWFLKNQVLGYFLNLNYSFFYHPVKIE